MLGKLFLCKQVTCYPQQRPPLKNQYSQLARKAAVVTVISMAECSTEVDRAVPGARETRGKSSKTCQEPAALASERG